MNIEIANRLVKLRKEKGMSQEDLADALGISRQAVSKWERAEASPDTDNLICLAKLYNISLDEILSSDESVEDIREEQKEKAKETEQDTIVVEDGEDTIHIGKHGIHLKAKDGSHVTINRKGIHAINKDGVEVTKENKPGISKYIEGPLFLLSVVGYILLGTYLHMWASAWIIFLAPEIICSTIRCFERKNPSKFNMPLLAVFVYFFVCMIIPGTSAHLWHPMWVVFLAIPVYYSIVKPFSHEEDDDDDDDEEEDKD